MTTDNSISTKFSLLIKSLFLNFQLEIALAIPAENERTTLGNNTAL